MTPRPRYAALILLGAIAWTSHYWLFGPFMVHLGTVVSIPESVSFPVRTIGRMVILPLALMLGWFGRGRAFFVGSSALGIGAILYYVVLWKHIQLDPGVDYEMSLSEWLPVLVYDSAFGGTIALAGEYLHVMRSSNRSMERTREG